MRFLPTFGLVLLAFPMISHADRDCERRGEISGYVETVNLNEQLQYGIAAIHLEKRGKTFFEGEGVVIGQVVGSYIKEGYPEPLPLLNHTIYFPNGTKLRTFGDKVESLIPTGVCTFDAVEKITTAKGTKKLRKLEDDGHQILAIGTVSYCPDDPRNSFKLEGTVCFD